MLVLDRTGLTQLTPQPTTSHLLVLWLLLTKLSMHRSKLTLTLSLLKQVLVHLPIPPFSPTLIVKLLPVLVLTQLSKATLMLKRLPVNPLTRLFKQTSMTRLAHVLLLIRLYSPISTLKKLHVSLLLVVKQLPDHLPTRLFSRTSMPKLPLLVLLNLLLTLPKLILVVLPSLET